MNFLFQGHVCHHDVQPYSKNNEPKKQQDIVKNSNLLGHIDLAAATDVCWKSEDLMKQVCSGEWLAGIAAALYNSIQPTHCGWYTSTWSVSQNALRMHHWSCLLGLHGQAYTLSDTLSDSCYIKLIGQRHVWRSFVYETECIIWGTYPQLAVLYIDNHCITDSTTSAAAFSTAEQQFSSVDQITIIWLISIDYYGINFAWDSCNSYLSLTVLQYF